jgi:hypothetical protein
VVFPGFPKGKWLQKIYQKLFPLKGKEEVMRNTNIKTVFLGDPLTREEQTSVISQVERLGIFFEKEEFGKIGKFYKKTGKVTAHDLKPIQGRDKIEKYFRKLHDDEVRSVKFTPECVYAQELKDTSVGDLIDKGVIQEEDVPGDISHDREVTHALHAIISISFTLKGKKYNQGPGSSWDGFHIHGCPIL